MGTESVATGFMANATEDGCLWFWEGGGIYLTWTMVPDMYVPYIDTLGRSLSSE